MKLRLLSALCMVLASGSFAAEFPATVVLKVGATAMSSLGTVGRIVAEHLGKHLPGEPTVEVEAVEGAFGVQLVRQLVETEPRDGSVVAMILPSVIQRYVIDPNAYDFRPAGLQWIGSLAKPVGVCVKDVDSDVEIADPGLRFGAASKTGVFYALATLLKHAMKSDASIIVGFKSENELVAALDRGEIDVYCGTSYSTYEREGRKATQVILGGFGNAEKLAELGMNDLSASFMGLDRQVLELATINYTYFYALALPAGADAENVSLYREAFATMIRDPAFKADIQTDVAEYAPTMGEEVQVGVDALLQTDPGVVARFSEIME